MQTTTTVPKRTSCVQAKQQWPIIDAMRLLHTVKGKALIEKLPFCSGVLSSSSYVPTMSGERAMPNWVSRIMVMDGGNGEWAYDGGGGGGGGHGDRASNGLTTNAKTIAIFFHLIFPFFFFLLIFNFVWFYFCLSPSSHIVHLPLSPIRFI